MQAILHPLPGAHDIPLRSGRRPLQPKNSNSLPIPVAAVAKIKPERIQISLSGDANKENLPPIPAAATATIESCDSSLADELNAVKRKLERLRSDGDRTEKMLRERDLIFELQMKELLRRGQEQRELEMEVDRLFRLKELRSYCMDFSDSESQRKKSEKRSSPMHNFRKLKSAMEKNLLARIHRWILQNSSQVFDDESFQFCSPLLISPNFPITSPSGSGS